MVLIILSESYPAKHLGTITRDRTDSDHDIGAHHAHENLYTPAFYETYFVLMTMFPRTTLSHIGQIIDSYFMI